MSICKVLSFGILLFYLANLLRLLIGPFPYAGVVVVHYGVRITTVACFTMHTFKTILKILFLLDFNKMISISEKKVMVGLWVVTSTCSLVYLAQEVTIRHTLGVHHFARRCFNIYLGQVGQIICSEINSIYFVNKQENIDDPLRNQSITSYILAFPLLAMVSSLLIFSILRIQREEQSLIQKYQNIIIESSANGLTTVGTFLALVFVAALLIGSYMAVEVGRFLFQLL